MSNEKVHLSLRQYLKKFRIRRGEFADSIGLHERTIDAIILGKIDPKRSTCLKISQATNGLVTTESLIEPEVDKTLEKQ